MCIAQISNLPWTAIVGVTGIVGTVVVAYLTNLAAEKRLLITQAQEDRTRFHSERIERYARLLTASQSCRLVALQCVHLFGPNAQPSNVEDRGAALLRCREAVTELIRSTTAVGLVASDPVHKAAQAMLTAGRPLLFPDMTAEETLVYDRKLDALETAFTEAARAELLTNHHS
jgi:hypothetical protein